MNTKNIIRGISLLAVVLAVAGCMRDRSDVKTPTGQTEATITLAGQTRGGGSTVDPDNVIGTFRIMAFRQGSVVAYNKKLDFSETNSHSMTMYTGTYDFLFIANEDSAGSKISEEMDEFMGYIEEIIDGSGFGSLAFTVDKAIPMVGIYRGVTVNSDNTVTLPGDDAKHPRWFVDVERLGIRVDLTLETDDAEVAASFSGLTAVNVPIRVWTSQTNSSGDRLYNNGSYETDYHSTAYRSFRADQGDVYTVVDGEEIFTASNDAIGFEEGEDGVWSWHKRIILPASEFADGDDATKAIKFRAGASNQTLSAILGNEILGYTAPRNTRFRMIGKLTPSTSHEILFSVMVTDWGTERRVPLDNTRKFTVSPANIDMIFDAQMYKGESNKVSVAAEGNWRVDRVTDEDNQTVDWLLVSTSNSNNVNGTSFTGNKDLFVNAKVNTTGNSRTAYVYLTDGSSTKKVEVNQGYLKSNCGRGGAPGYIQIGSNVYPTHIYGTNSKTSSETSLYIQEQLLDGLELLSEEQQQEMMELLEGLGMGSTIQELRQQLKEAIEELKTMPEERTYLCWMLENSKEYAAGNVAVKQHPDSSVEGERGYYYTFQQAYMENNACPEGWRLITSDDIGSRNLKYDFELGAIFQYLVDLVETRYGVTMEIQPNMNADVFSLSSQGVELWAGSSHVRQGRYHIISPNQAQDWNVAGSWWGYSGSTAYVFRNTAENLTRMIGTGWNDFLTPSSLYASVRCVKDVEFTTGNQ